MIACLRRALVPLFTFLLVTVARPALAADKAPVKVCLVSGAREYQSNETLAEFQKYLESQYDAKCARAFQEGADDEHLPGLENLEDADVILLFCRRIKLSGDQLERFKKYCLAGKPIVGVRTASHAVQTWLDLDKEVLGGNYQNHFKAGEKVKVDVLPGAQRHPILKGFEPFESGGTLYKNTGLAADCETLLLGRADGHTEPIAWTREYKGARIFYTSLGHQDDFAQPAFQRMLANAIFWTTRRDPQLK